MARAAYGSVLSAVVVSLGVAGYAAPAFAESKEAEKIGELVAKLKIGSLRERLEALERISQLRDVRQIHEWKIVERLQELADDPNPRVARRAVKALGDLVMGADLSIKEQVRGPLMKLLEQKGAVPLVRAEAASQLGRVLNTGVFADVPGVNALVKAATAESGQPEVAAAALLALGSIGDKRGKDAIRSSLSARDPMVKEAGLEALGKFLAGENAENIVDAALGGLLLRLLSDETLGPDAQERILESVGRAVKAGASKTQAEVALAKVLKEEKRPRTVVAALKAMGSAGSASVAPVLVNTYERFGTKEGEEQPMGDEVRGQVCATAGELFDMWQSQHELGAAARAAQLLSELLTTAMINDKSDTVRKEAIVALGNLYNRRYDRRKPVAALIALLGTLQGDDMKGMVAESIETLTGRSFGTDAERWERWFKSNQHKLGPQGH